MLHPHPTSEMINSRRNTPTGSRLIERSALRSRRFFRLFSNQKLKFNTHAQHGISNQLLSQLSFSRVKHDSTATLRMKDERVQNRKSKVQGHKAADLRLQILNFRRALHPLRSPWVSVSSNSLLANVNFQVTLAVEPSTAERHG